MKTVPPREAPNKELPPIPFEEGGGGGGGGGGGMEDGKWTCPLWGDGESCSLSLSFHTDVYSSIPDQLKVNAVATAGGGLEEGYYASPKHFEQVLQET